MIHPDALAALRYGQRRLDMEGSEVGVSRQALDEILADYETHEARGNIDYAVHRLYTWACVEAAPILRKDGVDAYKASAWCKLADAIQALFPNCAKDGGEG